ncbi:hypothetical protein [Metabacillus niabensis]|uniref:hypothetical protein n=1 Tax=Metabacillus niabensis TaxID=324854 RepID=UPI00366BD23E
MKFNNRAIFYNKKASFLYAPTQKYTCTWSYYGPKTGQLDLLSDGNKDIEIQS